MINKHQTLVLIPAFNEEATVGDVVRPLIKNGWTCLVVDDGSYDNTQNEAAKAGSIVIRHSINLGVGLALQTGFKWATLHGFDRVVQCDADGQHDVKKIEVLLLAQESINADLVIGSRFLDPRAMTYQLPSHRIIAIRFLSGIIKWKTGTKLTDPTSGFRCISGSLLNEFAGNFSSQFLGDTFEANLTALKNGYLVTEVHTEMFARKHGTSSASFLQSIRYLMRVLIVSILNLNFAVRSKND